MAEWQQRQEWILKHPKLDLVMLRRNKGSRRYFLELKKMHRGKENSHAFGFEAASLEDAKHRAQQEADKFAAFIKPIVAPK